MMPYSQCFWLTCPQDEELCSSFVSCYVYIIFLFMHSTSLFVVPPQWKYYYYYYYYYFLWRCGPMQAIASSFLRFLDHTQWHTTVGRTPLDEWSARRRDLYLTTHNTHNRQTSMSPVGFEPTISAGERPQTYTLNRAATGTSPQGK